MFLSANNHVGYIPAGASFQFFQGGGQNFDRLPRGGGAKYKKYNIL